MHVVFTDLDGTLLDQETYSWEAARPALELLERQRIPWIIVTSKTRAEVEVLRREMGGDRGFAERDALERAVRDLAAVGLVHRGAEFVTPTRAALRFSDLLDR